MYCITIVSYCGPSTETTPNQQYLLGYSDLRLNFIYFFNQCTADGNMARPDYTYTDTVLPITQIGTEPLAVISDVM